MFPTILNLYHIRVDGEETFCSSKFHTRAALHNPVYVNTLCPGCRARCRVRSRVHMAYNHPTKHKTFV